MPNNPGTESKRIIHVLLLGCILCGYSSYSLAWGQDGHSAIGILAMDQLNPDARKELENIIGSLDERAMIKACNWPDDVRETDGWEWTVPQHYINIPRGDIQYQQSRDCPTQQCATEAIKDYAGELADDQASGEERWQAFAWLCHLTADLHQPLHAGFADDRGGNDVDVIFKGKQMNLHRFWDSELIYQHAGSWQNLVSLLGTTAEIKSDSNWTRLMVNGWTSDSHQLATYSVYPETKNINEIYLQKSWLLTQQQISLAASRLALIINTELKDVNDAAE